MSNYNTGNPVPSIDPRDLDDNATIFDSLLNSTADVVEDRLGVPRKSWKKLEDDADALTSPNVLALAGLTGAADRVAYFTGAGAMDIAALTAKARTLIDDATEGAMLVTLGTDAPAATLASAATVSIGAQVPQTINVTGTTTITSLGPGTDGQRKRLIFSGALTFTHNASSLIIPGALSITTSAGDSCEVLCLGSSNWKVLSYTYIVGDSIGSDANGEWLKMANGLMVKRRQDAVTTALSSAIGALFYKGSAEAIKDMPGATPFITAPWADTKVYATTTSAWIAGDTGPSTTQWGSCYILEVISRTSAPYTLSYIAIGRWK